MPVRVAATSWGSVTGDWLVIGVPEKFEISGPLAEFDKALNGQLAQLRERQDLTGKLGQVVILPTPSGIQASRVMFIGLGAADKVAEGTLLRALTVAARHISTKQFEHVAVAIPTAGSSDFTTSQRVQTAATAMLVGGVGQDLYKTEKKRFPIENVLLLVEGTVAEGLPQAANAGVILGEAMNLTRELVNLPAKVLYPESFAERAEVLARQHALGCEVLDLTRLEAEKMGSLLAVSDGSDRPPRLVCLDYNNAPAGAPVLALVGKGVTFDSGGLSLKTTEQMLTMKCDMAGAATVLASVIAIARFKLPVHVIGLMGLVENMTGGMAMKLGDVLTSRAGVTIEVQNTDAEGRLVLADVLDYALSKGASKIVDLATLTGAVVVALGEDVVGAMSNNQEWCDDVLATAEAVGEPMWQLPMFESYNALIDSDVADIRNVGGRYGGAITAAKFLERFVKDIPWVHLDIAGPAFAGSDKPHREGGGTGVMVRTLVELARRFKTEKP